MAVIKIATAFPERGSFENIIYRLKITEGLIANVLYSKRFEMSTHNCKLLIIFL